ncbi:hypothetical protein [Kitasatospora phosalacinea]|uniref:Uncharacterized protein n=1 Tax=Kitasatospora phosalacinea TaxID=2065 RepID=A0ABW6GI85_9ACTN
MDQTIVRWGRVEPHAATPDIAVGLAAETADPLWFLLRQWQLGELTGDDGGSPVALDTKVSWSRFTRYRPEGTPGRPAVALGDAAAPLERLVEQEAVLTPGDPAATPWTAAVRAGRSLRRHLAARHLTAVADALAARPDLRFDAAAPDGAPLGPDEVRYRRLLAGRVLDGAKVLALLADGPLPAGATAGADPGALADALRDWQRELAEDWGVLAPGADPAPPSWVPDRFEYAFSLAAPPLPPAEPPAAAAADAAAVAPAAELVLRAPAYDGTGLAWYDLDLDADAAADPGRALGAAADGGATGQRTATALPAPLRYPGMPADRFWEFEDARVSLGAATGGPTDLARMLAVDFALVHGPDWYLAPVEVPVGCVARVDWVVVRDTFGAATLVGTAATRAGDGVGRQFQPAAASGPEGDHPLLVVLPSAGAALGSPPLERVALQRDEAADLAWAIEQRVLGPSGRGIELPWQRSEFDLPRARSASAYELVWRLATPVARSWTPLVPAAPRPGAPDGPRLLRRARLLETRTGELRAARSRILRDAAGGVRDEEVTRGGVEVRMLDQLVRRPDGSSHVWRGREKRPGRGEATSGLRFDAATPDLERGRPDLP